MNTIKKKCSAYLPELLIFALYLLGTGILAAFHEPWFDEAEAWQIAKCASWRDLCFELPHYEGHPPLWHLLLAVFAKSGAPYELSLKAVNLAFCAGAVALLLFASPLPRFLRCVLPFTYFFFYQYAIVNRPYSLLTLAMLLAAAAYRGRNRHPWRYILSLSLLCLSCAYGILIAGGLCLAWTGEIFAEYHREKKWRGVYRDARAYSLFFILVLALALYLVMRPVEKLFYLGYDDTFSDKLVMTPLFFTIPFDSFFGAYNDLDMATPGSWLSLVLACLGGAAVLGTMVLFVLKNQKFFTFLFPFLLYMGFSIFGYCSTYHIGIFTMFTLFLLWIILEEKGRLEVPDVFMDLWRALGDSRLKKVIPALGAGLCFVPVFYAAVSSINDIRLPYGPKPVADFILENHLEDRPWMVTWMYEYEDTAVEGLALEDATHLPSEHPKLEKSIPSEAGLSIPILPYLEKNCFINLNVQEPEKEYITHKLLDPEEEYALWAKKGLPDFVAGYVPLDVVYSEEELEGVRYIAIAELKNYQIWKLTASPVITYIYMREDLLDEYPQFTPVLLPPQKENS